MLTFEFTLIQLLSWLKNIDSVLTETLTNDWRDPVGSEKQDKNLTALLPFCTCLLRLQSPWIQGTIGLIDKHLETRVQVLSQVTISTWQTKPDIMITQATVHWRVESFACPFHLSTDNFGVHVNTPKDRIGDVNPLVFQESYIEEGPFLFCTINYSVCFGECLNLTGWDAPRVGPWA